MTVRAECTARIAKKRGIEGCGKEKLIEESGGEKENEGQDRTRREGTSEHSSASDRTWKLEESGADKNKGKSDQVDNTVASRQLTVKEKDATC